MYESDGMMLENEKVVCEVDGIILNGCKGMLCENYGTVGGEWMVIEVDGMVCEGEGWSVKVNGCCGKMMSSSVCKVSY